jgi:mycofactocin precursor
MADVIERDTHPQHGESAAGTPEDAELVVDELLVEEISIDGMCGVY